MDFNVKLRNGQVMRGLIISAGEKASGVVIFVHGLGDHINRYKEWSAWIREAGFTFAGVDLPGHGRSDGKRGHVSDFGQLHEVLDILISSCRKTFPGLPLYLYGHSLGGLIVLDYLLEKKPSVKAAIVTSPWLKLAFEPSAFKVGLASVMKFLMPSLVQSSGLVVDYLSHNKEVTEAYKADVLVHDKISVSMFNGAIRAASRTLANAANLKTNTLIIHGSDDMITSPEGSREFASKAARTKLRIWEGGYHELQNEAFRKEVLSEIINWLKTPEKKQVMT